MRAARCRSQAAPLQREHRLYQADWLFRFYGFEADEITAGLPGGMLDLDIDPKLAWALRHRGRFPVDVNKASREELLRIPGLGTKTIDRMIVSRRHRTLRLDDVQRLAGSVRRARPFIVTADHRPTPRTRSARSARNAGAKAGAIVSVWIRVHASRLAATARFIRGVPRRRPRPDRGRGQAGPGVVADPAATPICSAAPRRRPQERRDVFGRRRLCRACQGRDLPSRSGALRAALHAAVAADPWREIAAAGGGRSAGAPAAA